MSNVEHQIHNILYTELSNLITKISEDFHKNYSKKYSNFLVTPLDESLIGSLTFTSSYESKIGNTIELCARAIAKLRYGESNVPHIINPHNLDTSSLTIPEEGQHVVTNIPDKSEINGVITNFIKTDHKASKKSPSTANHETMTNELFPLYEQYATPNVYSKPVDLAFYDGENWYIFEIKAGGALDSSNAPSNVEKLVKIYFDMGIRNCKPYFATLYNKDGEGHDFTGAVKSYLAYPECFMIGSKFWEKILPEGITFTKFTTIYSNVITELNISKKITELINKETKHV